MVGVLVAVLVAGAAGGARAQSLKELLDARLDPELDYRTLRTAHFDVHFPAHLEAVARRIAARAESARPRVARLFGVSPERTHIVVTEHSDETQIFTFVYPHRQIFYDAVLPHAGIGLNDYADWHDWLLTHEYAHVAHLEAREGMYAHFASVLGSWVRPNMSSPPWLKEGLAEWAETALTPHGRGRSSTDRMLLRTAVAEGRLRDPEFAALDTISNFDAKSWPWTFRPYVFGFEMIRQLVAMRGAGAVAELVRAGATVQPYDLDAALRAVGVSSLKTLWRATLAAIERDARRELADIARRPVTSLTYLTHAGYLHHGIALSPNGKWLVSTREDPDQDIAIIKIDLDGDRVSRPEVLVDRTSGYQASFSRSSRFLLFDMVTRARRHYLMSDLFVFDLKSREFLTGTDGRRARDPDVHPDGKHIAFIENRAGRNRLLVTESSWANEVVLLDEVGYRRLSGPRFSPDGARLALSVHDERTGGEELWLVDQAGHQVLLSNGAQNRSPSWTPDGSMLLFTSDRTGVFNVHAYDLARHKLFQVTNVVGGLFYPVVDRELRWVYAVSAHSRGYDVARFRWNPTSWQEVPLPAPVTSPAPEPAVELAAGDATPYSAWRYLAPQYLLPSFELRPDSYQLGGRIGATDPLYFHRWDLALRYDSSSELPAGRLSYFHGPHRWAADLEVVHDAVAVGEDETLRSLDGRLHLNIPLSETGTYSHLRPGLASQNRWFRGASHAAGAGLGLRYDTTFRQIGQSFPETGILLDVEATQWVTTSDQAPLATSVEGRAAYHHGLGHRRQAVHLAGEGGAFVLGREDPNAVFYAGGVRSFPSAITSPFVLYGFPPNLLVAPSLVIGTALYTVEAADIQRGPPGVPLALGRLSAGLRLQAAYSEGLLPEPSLEHGLPWSAGLELYQELTLGYLFGFTARLGAYRGAPSFGGEYQLVFTLAGS